jgi:hypothetical protein
VIVAALLLFRDPLTNLIRSLRRLGYKDAGLDFAQQESSAPAPALQAPDAAVRELPPTRDVVIQAPAGEAAAHVPAPTVGAPAVTPDALAVERQVDTFLARTSDPYVQSHDEELRRGLEEGGLLNHPNQAIRLLIRFTDLWFVNADFERMFGIMWGGQITLLRELNAVPMPLARVTTFVAEWVARNHLPDSTERWVQFLAVFGLAEQKDNELHITPKGRSFILFIAQSGKPERPQP